MTYRGGFSEIHCDYNDLDDKVGVEFRRGGYALDDVRNGTGEDDIEATSHYLNDWPGIEEGEFKRVVDGLRN